MMKTTPKPEPPFRTIPAGESLTLDVTFNAHQADTCGESSVKSGFESGTLWSRSRDLATRTPLPSLRARNLRTIWTQRTSIMKNASFAMRKEKRNWDSNVLCASSGPIPPELAGTKSKPMAM
ncbi:hypothetical protein AVEN_239864-1 [Araneus ventricosus]|uniref:Uncharacterized protein n=1 Tax=Araneus ventricosus TaxID=182803 RepID=A0A4Y2FBF4_ARAVE|nr:hypothetical protein AVEN_239864-1 [Araneus ventricosus]